MDSFICNSGLFIPVCEFASTELSDLPGTVKDAERLRIYFEAMASGNWTVPTDSRLLRIGILNAVRKWASTVPARTAGILCLFTHGYETKHGLVFAGSDFDPSCIYDSGVPLERIVQILSADEFHNRRFIVIADCCRVGENAHVPLTAGHLSIVYTVPAGRSAIDNIRGGFLVQGILNGVKTIPPQTFAGQQTVRFERLLIAIDECVRDAGAAQGIEYHIADPSRVLIPLNSVPSDRQLADKIVSIRLRTFLFDSGIHDDVHAGVAEVIANQAYDGELAGRFQTVTSDENKMLSVECSELESMEAILIFLRSLFLRLRSIFVDLELDCSPKLSRQLITKAIKHAGFKYSLQRAKDQEIISFKEESDKILMLSFSVNTIAIHVRNEEFDDAIGVEEGFGVIRKLLWCIVRN